MKKTNKNPMLIATFVISVIHLVLITIVGLCLIFNLFGTMDYYNRFVSTYLYSGYDLSKDITMFVFETILNFGVNLYICNFYFKGIKYRVNNSQYGKVLIYYAIIQILFSSILGGIFALITAIIMINRKPAKVNADASVQTFLSEYKLMAMSEAVTRLKELRASGAISEEEYYANLDKILEG